MTNLNPMESAWDNFGQYLPAQATPYGNTPNYSFMGDSGAALSQAVQLPQVTVDPNMMTNPGAASLWQKFGDASFVDKASGIGSLITGAVGAYNGYNSVKLGKEQMAFTKNAWNKQYDAQRNLTNSSLGDRQAARVASNPNAYQSVDSYMSKYGVK